MLLLLCSLLAGARLALPDRPSPDGSTGDPEDQVPDVVAPQPEARVPVDETFFDVAAATGGDFYFWTPGEFAGATDLSIPMPGEIVLAAYGEFEDSRSFTFPVDGLLSRLEVFVGAEGLEGVTLLDPHGEAVQPAPSRRVQAYRRMRIFTLHDAWPGDWTLELTGDGLFSVSVRGSYRRDPAVDLEPIEVIAAEFVELGGRPGHEGWFGTDTVPPAGQEAVLRLYVSGSHAGFEPVFLGRDGSRIDSDWRAGPEQGTDEDQLFHVRVPEVPFRIAVEGVDVLGHLYRRSDAPLLATP